MAIFSFGVFYTKPPAFFSTHTVVVVSVFGVPNFKSLASHHRIGKQHRDLCLSIASNINDIN